MVYDHELLKAIVNGVDLRQYVSSFLPTTTKGGKCWANCVFHEEKTPSLLIDEHSYHCFGCGEHGDIVDWLRKYEDLSFTEAVDKAARLAAVDQRGFCQSQTYLFNRSLCAAEHDPATHAVVAKAAWNSFRPAQPKQWLDEGISKEAMQYFDIRYDEATDRIVYPVCMLDGTQIGVKGRTTLDAKLLGIPKYMNYYKINRIDFLQSLDKTIDDVRKSGEIILFEGIKSVMKAWGWGWRNAASVESHAINQDQVELLVSLGVDVTVAFDSDVDFKSEALKRSLNLLARFLNVYVVRDRNGLLGGPEAKNAPVDCGKDVWQELYDSKERWVAKK